jgi:hypothetical protein
LSKGTPPFYSNELAEFAEAGKATVKNVSLKLKGKMIKIKVV